MTGAHSYQQLASLEVKKKRALKEEEKVQASEEFPVKVNLLKFLAEERRQCILDFSRDKINYD